MFDEEFISEINGKFSIDRVFNDVKYNFGIFDSYDEALNYLNYLEEEGWPLEVNNQVKNNLPNNIEEIDGKFSVFKYIMGEKITFGEYDTLDKAKMIKNNLISNAWESLEFNDRGAYGKYIRKSGNKFVVSRRYMGETHNFGYFNTLDEAIEVREHLVETNWGDLNIKHEMRLGKYIAFNGIYYTIQKVIDGNPVIFGFFNDLEDARKQRDLLVQDNWSRLEVPDDSTRHIRKDKDKYIIYNYIDDEFQFFGEYYSLDEAKEKRNELVLNDWIIPEEKKIIEVITENIFYDGEFYTVEKQCGDEIRIYGVFKNKNRAIDCKKDLINNGWDSNFAIKTNQYPYGENIVPFDYIFIVEFLKNGKLIELGNYMSFEEALIARNEYLGLNNNDGGVKRLVFSVKVGKSYKNRGWSIIRDSTYDLIPKLEYEDNCNIIVDGIHTKAKFNILPRIFYDSNNGDVISHLKELNESDPDKRIDVELLLDKDMNDDNVEETISELNGIIESKDNEISRLGNAIEEKHKQISELNGIIESKDNEISLLIDAIEEKNKQVSELKKKLNLDNNMKTLNVVAAIIHKDGKILATKRGYGEFINQWEFPGGKIEDGETKEEALIREIKEELNIDIDITNFALDIEYQYPTFYLKMSCFDCVIKSGTPELLEHNDARWLSKDELDDVNWIPADVDAVSYLKESMFEVEILEKMKKVDEEMRKCNYDLDKLKDLYDNTEDKFEKQLLFAEIRSIEISNSIIIDKND